MSKTPPATPLVGIIMGSESDWPTMKIAAETCAEFQIPHESRVVSAHRMPSQMFDYAQNAEKNGLKVIIAGAGGAAHLPGMVASLSTLPVIGVPIVSKTLNGVDSLLSIVQMPQGIPVATVAIGNARNAALLALQILALTDPALRDRLHQFRATMTKHAETMTSKLVT